MTLLSYLISIPLGIRKAVNDGSPFDIWTSGVIIVGYAIPGFLFAILLIILFAGGSFFQIFPLRGLVSDTWSQLPWWLKILDYFWHLILPITSMGLAAFAAFVSAFFAGSLLIETIFSLDGLGLLSFESVLNRDYPVVFANLYIFALVGLVVNLISDLTYTWIDPRIDFETREV
jgi:microcin C transport system permease protein